MRALCVPLTTTKGARFGCERFIPAAPWQLPHGDHHPPLTSISSNPIFLQTQITDPTVRWVQREARPISLRQLTFFGRTLTESRLIDSANYCREELPTRWVYSAASRKLCFGVYIKMHVEYPTGCATFKRFRMLSLQIPTLPTFMNSTYAHLSGFAAFLKYEHLKPMTSIAKSSRRPSPSMRLSSHALQLVYSRLPTS